MIERHYFRDHLLKSFDFDFGFCIPNSRNTCEHIYEFPQLSESLGESSFPSRVKPEKESLKTITHHATIKRTDQQLMIFPLKKRFAAELISVRGWRDMHPTLATEFLISYASHVTFTLLFDLARSIKAVCWII